MLLLDYFCDFLPKARVVGADIDQKILLQEDQIISFAVDQADTERVRHIWARLGKSGFQLMIDDGHYTF